MMTLQTGFKRIGTAGKTVDGREIDEKWLKEAVKSYDHEKYAAVINYSHLPKKWFGSFGKVLGIKSGKDPDGNYQVLANLEPNNKLIAMSQEETLFASMEIDIDFQKSGKSYLVGLAVTPDPASIGTEQLKFSHKEPGNIRTTQFMKIDLSDLSNQEHEKNLINRFMNYLSSENTINHDEHKQDTEPMSTALDKKTVEELTTVLSSVSAQLKSFSTNQPAAEPKQGAEKLLEMLAPGLKEYGIEISVPEPEKTDSQKIELMAQQLEALTQKVDQFTKQGSGEDTPPEDKPENTQLVELQSQMEKISKTLNLAISGEQPGTGQGDQTNLDDDNGLV